MSEVRFDMVQPTKKRRQSRLSSVAFGVATFLFLLAAQSRDLPRVVSSTQVLRLVAEANPELHTALLERQKGATQVEAEQGLYPFILALDSGLSHQSTPMATSNAEIAYREVNQVSLGASLRKTLPVGTTVELLVQGDRQVAGGTVSSVEQVSTQLPTYAMTSRLSIAQPILRGAGKRVGESSLREALAAEAVAGRGADNVASALARRALVAYWELWYGERALEIDLRAREIAMAQLEEVRTRIETGAAAPADELALRARLAAMEEIVLSTTSERDRLAVVLETLTGAIRQTTRLAPDLSENPPEELKADEGAAAKLALESSPVVRKAAADLYAAQERARISGESMRQRLDIIGWIMAQTMGVDGVSPLVTQLGDGPAYSAYLGISYELPLSNRRKDAQQAMARVEVEIARSRLVAATDQARGDVATASRMVESARQRVTLARQTLAVAQEQAEAVRQRASMGAAIYVEVREAEEAVREAALRVARAQVDLGLAGISLDHVTGALLAKTALTQ